MTNSKQYFNQYWIIQRKNPRTLNRAIQWYYIDQTWIPTIQIDVIRNLLTNIYRFLKKTEN